jgi:hypothetical protein
MAHSFYIGQRVRIGPPHDPEWAHLEGRSGSIETTTLYSDDTPAAEGPTLGVWLRDAPGRGRRKLDVFDFEKSVPDEASWRLASFRNCEWSRPNDLELVDSTKHLSG